MATKKQAKKDLAEEVNTLGHRIAEFTTSLERPGGFIQKLEQFLAMSDLIAKRHEEFKNILGSVIFPQDALNELTGELRAVRNLLDKDAEYSFLDKARLRLAKDKITGKGGASRQIIRR